MALKQVISNVCSIGLNVMSCLLPKCYNIKEDDNDDEDEAEETVRMDDEEVQKSKRLEKKRRLKERFDAEYDDGDATYFDDLKEEMQKQAEVKQLF